jgi:hypothetical protein
MFPDFQTATETPIVLCTPVHDTETPRESLGAELVAGVPWTGGSALDWRECPGLAGVPWTGGSALELPQPPLGRVGPLITSHLGVERVDREDRSNDSSRGA